ncbi:Disease resistance protein RPM1 [Zea mays]|uniref:Disease resistance protein RPM1 n=2 Tax=Zea mays TaxID=4577 RepID=A0A1D6J110_MAIZE|nr:Disease resistance protein RPM1 [Zea mays]
MAELASGAVTSLLGVIRSEWRLLGRVGGDVHFIREEMESMNSFLMHLARTTPPGGEHDEQVQTWMNQVRVLANDCNNCIDLYLYRGNPDIHLGRDRLRRYLRWVPWFLQKTVAQHRAALELSVLKERARDVGKRRLRYGVEVPKKAAVAPASPGAAAGAQGGNEAAAAALFHADDVEDGGGHDQAWERATAASSRIRRALFGIYVREDYLSDLLAEWIQQVRAQPQWSAPDDQGRHDTRCGAFLVPKEESVAIARQASAVAEKHVKNTILLDIPSLHRWRALGPKNVLYYILREIELKQQKTQADAKSQGWRPIREEKRRRIEEIKNEIEKLKAMDKIQEIKNLIENVKDNNQKLQPYLSKPKRKEDHITKEKIRNKNHALPELLVLLLMSSAAADKTDEKIQWKALEDHYDVILQNAAKSLKEHMDQVNKGAAKGQGIIHNVAQYARILQDVFPSVSSSSNNNSTRQPQDAQEQEATAEATTGKIQIIIDKVKQDILSEVFEAVGGAKAQEATKTDTTTRTTAATTLDEAQVKKMIQEAIHQLKEEKPADKKQETDVSGGQGSTAAAPRQENPDEKKAQPDTTGSSSAQQGSSQGAKASTVDEATKKTGELLVPIIKQTTEKMGDLQRKIKRQLDINGIVAKIRSHLTGQETMIILRVDYQHVDEWEKTRSALSLLPRVAVMMILTKTDRNLERARTEYCHPQGEPMDYTYLAAFYHHIALEITGLHQKSTSSDDDAAQQIRLLRAIFDKCEPYFMCMKIFAQTLYARPRRSKQELQKLYSTLEGLQQRSYRSIAMKMLKFSYRDVKKEYQSSLLYLAIFPPGHRIRRSTLIARWVVERMVTTEDWRWSSAVSIAEQCFDALVIRGLVHPTEISATGRVKSCMVGDVTYDFITKMAKKRRILEPRLSHHLACHFSVFSDLHLSVSDNISNFLNRLSESSQWPRLKVLDLEGCRGFRENRHYLPNICNKIVLLKYLSLRRTDVDKLPHEINNLRELEVLDIQQTEVPASCTMDLLLLKLKRLLAGNRNPSPRTHGHVLVPGKIDKMSDMEVLSNVRVKSDKDLEGIGRLWQLRKLGVVINVKDKDTLLKAVTNLHECLRSLSITLDATTSHKGTFSTIRGRRELEGSSTGRDEKKIMKEHPKVLESLSISGDVHITPKRILPSELTDKSTPLIKLTLSNTLLTQDDLVALANLHMLRCLKLRHNTYPGNKLAFKQVRFQKLEYLLVEGSNWIEISFEEDTAAPELVKVVLCFEIIESIAGVDRLKKLEELELNKCNKDSDKTDPATAAGVTNAPVPSTATAPYPAPSAPTAASAVATDHVPSSTPTIRNPAPSRTTTTASAANPTQTTTSTNQVLLPELLSSAKQVSKVTLHGTMLKQGDLRALARMENIRCLVLSHGSYDGSQLDVNKDEFPRLNVLVVRCPTVTGIKFEAGSSPQLEKLVWAFAEMKTFSSIENLTRLKKLELIGHSLPDKVKEDIDKHRDGDRIHYTHYKPPGEPEVLSSKKRGKRG